jgi:hypothetical protein
VDKEKMIELVTKKNHNFDPETGIRWDKTLTVGKSQRNKNIKSLQIRTLSSWRSHKLWLWLKGFARWDLKLANHIDFGSV